MESTHTYLLEKALQECNYELAALVIVYGLLSKGWMTHEQGKYYRGYEFTFDNIT